MLDFVLKVVVAGVKSVVFCVWCHGTTGGTKQGSCVSVEARVQGVSSAIKKKENHLGIK